MNIQEELKKIITAFNADGKDVEQKYQKLYVQEVADGRTPDQASEKAMRRLYLSYRRDNLGKSVKFQGLILGVRAEYDNSREARDTAMEKFKENPAKAIAEGYVNDKGQLLDNDPFLGDGKTKNFNYRKPLQENDFSRMVWGLMTGLSDDGNTPVTPLLPTTIWCRGESVGTPPTPMMAYDLAGILKNQGKATMIINSSKVTKFHVIQNPPRKTIYDTIKNMCNTDMPMAGHFLSAEHLAEWASKHDQKTLKQDVVFVEGDILVCDPEVNEKGGSWKIVVDDGTENGLMCFIPKNIVPTCAEDDRVVLVANVRPANEKYSVGLNVMGILLHPDYQLPVEVPQIPKDQKTLDHTGAKDPKSVPVMTTTAPVQTGTTAQIVAQPEQSKKEDKAPSVESKESKVGLHVDEAIQRAMAQVRVLLSQAGEIDYLELVKQAGEKNGITADIVERAVRDCMMKGEVYEPKVGRIKWVMITPGTKY